MNYGNPPSLTLLGGPAPLALPCVLLRFAANERQFSLFLLSDRSVCVPQWLDPSLITEAAERARQFEKDHRVVVHELLKRARGEINVIEGGSGTIEKKPLLSRTKDLVFRIVLDDAELVLHVSRHLVPCQIHVANGEHCNSRRLFEAYDLALEYMQSHVEELDTMGFDVSILRLSVQDWMSYRERMRLV